jgi:hypothetical protein
VPGSGGGFVPRPPTATPFLTPTPSPSPEGAILVTPIPATPTRNIQIIPLPTNTPATSQQVTINIELTVYFDNNNNFQVEIEEGVQDVAIAIYDNTTNELLAFGYTNEAGAIRFSSIAASGTVRVSIPYLQYTQTVIGDTITSIRIAPYTQ